ncbi:MAG: alpha/beta fold hydrolase [Gemmatimonadaceae bacterium]
MSYQRIRCALAGWLRSFAMAASIAAGSTMLAGQPAQAQLAYDRTVFLHGGNGTPNTWLAGSTPTRLAATIVLGTNSYRVPDLLGKFSVASQSARLRDSLNVYQGLNVLIAHSMGGLVARTAYINNSANIAGIVTVASPHQGMPLANNFVLIKAFALDAQRRVQDAWFAIGQMTGYISYIIAGSRLPLDQITQFIEGAESDALYDLKVGSTTILNLNGYTSDQPSRANVYGTIPHQNAVFRMGLSSQGSDAEFAQFVKDRNTLVTVFQTCKFIGYITIIGHVAGRQCSYARKMLRRVDDRWGRYATMIETQGTNYQRPFDGLVPNERSVYPGLSFSDRRLNFQANMANHSNITYSSVGVQQIANAMAAIGMQVVQPPPSTLSISIAGPTQIQPGATCTWDAPTSGGSPPYSYQWTNAGQPAGNDYYYTGSKDWGDSNSWFIVAVSVTDAAGAIRDAEVTVYETSSAGICAF